jgi:hypothetical protein
MAVRRFWILVLFLCGFCSVLGCGDSTPAGGSGEPTEKQKQKEKMKHGTPDSQRGKSK